MQKILLLFWIVASIVTSYNCFAFQSIVVNKTHNVLPFYYHKLNASADLIQLEPNDSVIIDPAISSPFVLLFCADYRNSHCFLISDGFNYEIIENENSISLFAKSNDRCPNPNIFKSLADSSDIFIAVPIRRVWQPTNRLNHIAQLTQHRLRLLHSWAEKYFLTPEAMRFCENVVLAYQALDLIYLGKKSDQDLNRYEAQELLQFHYVLEDLISSNVPFDCYPFNEVIRCEVRMKAREKKFPASPGYVDVKSLQVKGAEDISAVMLSDLIWENSKIRYNQKRAFTQELLAVSRDTVCSSYIRSKLENELRASNFTDQIVDQFGKTRDLKQFLKSKKGKYVYLDFWASWCMPCITEIRKLKQDLLFSNRNLEYVLISVDKDKYPWQKAVAKYVPDFLRAHSFLLNRNFTSDIAKRINLSEIPRFVLIDPQGELINLNAPAASDPWFAELLKKIQ